MINPRVKRAVRGRLSLPAPHSASPCVPVHYPSSTCRPANGCGLQPQCLLPAARRRSQQVSCPGWDHSHLRPEAPASASDGAGKVKRRFSRFEERGQIRREPHEDECLTASRRLVDRKLLTIPERQDLMIGLGHAGSVTCLLVIACCSSWRA